MVLIPGLPDHIARALFSVAKAWKSELRSSEFWRHRKQLYSGKQLILFKWRIGNMCKLILLEPKTRIWSELPRNYEFQHGFCFTIASLKWGFVVIADPTLHIHCMGRTRFCNRVFVFDYLSAKWQRGANMPEDEISIHSCTSDRNRMVYVLCHQNFSKICIMVYDVMKNKWTSRIDKVECEDARTIWRMIYQSGKIYFFHQSLGAIPGFAIQVLNISPGGWGSQFCCQDYGSYGMCLSDDGERYSYRINGTLAIYKDFTWKDIVQLPIEFERLYYITTWKSKLLLIRRKAAQEQCGSYFESWIESLVLDLKNHKWTKLDLPKELIRGEIEADCYWQI